MSRVVYLYVFLYFSPREWLNVLASGTAIDNTRQSINTLNDPAESVRLPDIPLFNNRRRYVPARPLCYFCIYIYIYTWSVIQKKKKKNETYILVFIFITIYTGYNNWDFHLFYLPTCMCILFFVVFLYIYL